jgi:hypothetical protein
LIEPGSNVVDVPGQAFGVLFRAASQTMLTIAADPRHLEGRIGITADTAADEG